ncbi:MAG: TlpA disulfide reductase family protein [Daejeonella sp.]|uniref:TlpA disulfide reductase family protein n=1 Tax=Daejeonella sp. TaxID=2805397 RepID=UPI002732805D|nr:TlpA disulfide reductase family protein [Daejeonella sp.]MDP3466812.1 TlpA disulfide reductase family protein [Daejeonella sp.]
MRIFKYIIYFTILLVCPLISFAQQASYFINGTVSNPEIKSLYFTESSFFSNVKPKVQKVDVIDGKFSIKGAFNEPVPVFLSIDQDYKKDPAKSKQFILDNGSISVLIKGGLNDALVSGSKAQDDMERLSSGQVPYFEKLNQIGNEAELKSQAGISPDSIAALYRIPFRNANRELIEFQRSFVKENPSAFASILLIPSIAGSKFNFFEADSLLSSLSSGIQSSSTAKLVKDYIDSEKKTSVGAFAPEFALSDTSGKAIPLSSLKGKYVLLDFWAAWCAPCRQENPNVVNAHRQFKNQGFTVFGVSLDRDKKSWLAAIREDNLNWQHVSDLKYWGSEAATLYRISSIPRNFLLDPNGKIIGRDLRGPDLLDKLNELFPNKK